MKLNPITALSELLGKLVIEHGSAVITEKNLAFLRDQLTAAEKEITALTNGLEESETENKALTTENHNLKDENLQLKQKIKAYEQPAHNNLLDEIKVKILMFLATQLDPVFADRVSQAVAINIQIVVFHLNELKNTKMVTALLNARIATRWLLAHEGRRYLIEHGLIS